MSNKSVESGHTCLVPDLRGNAFRFSQLSMMLAVGLSYVAFFMLRYVLCPLCWEFLLVDVELWCLKLFMHLLRWSDDFFLQLVNVVCHVYCFVDILNHLCIPRTNPTWAWVWSFQCIFEFSLLIFCWGFLCLCSSVILACNFLFLWCLCLVLVSGWCWPRRMCSEAFLPLQFFWDSLRRIGVNSSLNVL